MQFASFDFIVFFTIALFIYLIIPKQAKYLWLLVCSFVFYLRFGYKYVLFLIGTIIVTYIGALIIEWINEKSGFDNDKKAKFRKIALSLVTAACIVQLSIFKYTPLNAMMPIGISFYTFAVMGYLFDVYKGKSRAIKNIAKYALFVSFFPNIVSGPIERTNHFMVQIEDMGNHRIWNYDKFIRGFITMMWGFFLKMVLADRISAFVDVIFDNYTSYGTIMLAGGAVAYSIQIYADFAGYSLIAIGSALMMGIELFENFNVPYLARNIRDFWSRWHMSLSSWLKDYVYIPIGGSRCPKYRNYLNLMITFLVSGAWHGNGMRFVFWGFLHGFYQVLSKVTMPFRKKIRDKLKIGEESAILIVWQTLWTFVMVTIAWIFFRISTIIDGFNMIVRMVSKFDLAYIFANGIHDVGFDNRDVLAMLIAFFLLAIVSLYKYTQKVSFLSFILKCPTLIRMILVMALIFLILIFGEYGPGAYSAPFVYAQF